ncbi:MAG: RNA polymerase sigma factor [Acidimicrobiia bacterium]|nr:RNA polymerase sigma factor [Acidimicrobiia bacterium]
MATPTAEQRFRVLYDEHHPAINAYFVRRIGSQDAPDAADAVFTVAWRRLSKVPEEPETLRWLYGVAHNVLANRRRGERRGNRLLARLGNQRQPDLLGPEPQVLRNLEGQHVVEVLGTMRPNDQELVLLSYWEGLSHAEIGELLGCSKGAVDARMHRVLERMRKAMGRTGHTSSREAGRASAAKDLTW